MLTVGDEIATVLRPGAGGVWRDPGLFKRREGHGAGPAPGLWVGRILFPASERHRPGQHRPPHRQDRRY
ncbi:MAG: hypothetical protein V8S34_00220, partial [Lawsonibacter sp.]